MNSRHAVDIAVEIAKTTLAEGNATLYPNGDTAADVAEFIETLTARLEAMDYNVN